MLLSHHEPKPAIVPTPRNIGVPEYFNLVNGLDASFNKIRDEHPMMEHAVDSLMRGGKVVGQGEFVPQPDGGVIFDVQLHRIAK